MLHGFPLREPIGMALETIRAHKLRSFLMLLGIIISVSTLILVIALISGVEEYVKAARRNKVITWEDFQALHDGLKLPQRVGAEVRTSGKVRAGTQEIEDSGIRGVTSNIGEIDIEEPIEGRYISDGDDQSRAMVTMIGNDLATKLFPYLDPIGREVWIDGCPFTVVGVAKPLGTVFGQSQD